MGVPVVLIRQRRIIRRFRDAGATEPSRAVPPESLVRRRGFPYRRLVATGVLREASPGLVYLDQDAERRRRLDRVGAAIGLLIGSLLAIGTGIALLVF